MDGSGAFPGGDCGGSCRVGLSGPRVAQVWCLGEVSGASGKVQPRSRVIGCSIDRSPPALADSDAGVPAVVLCQPLRTERGSFTSLFMQTRNSSASAPPWAFTPSLACVLGLLREASEALRDGRSSVSRRIPFQTHRKAKPGNILSLLLCCLCSLYWICW